MWRREMVRSVAAAALAACLLGCPFEDDGAESSGSVLDELRPAPAEPANLVCASHQLDVFLSWENPEEYSQIQVLREGRVVAVLGGGACSVTDSPGEAGSWTYALVGVGARGKTSREASCDVTTRTLATVEHASCVFSAAEDTVTVAWSVSEGEAPEAFRLSRDGVMLAELGGGARGYADAHPPEGTIEYELHGVRDGMADEGASCAVTVEGLGRIANLSGTMDATNGDILLGWRNGDEYDDVVVLCGGEQVAILDGSDTSLRFSHEGCGLYTFSVCGRRGGRESEMAHWQCDVGRLTWLADTSGRVSGYQVYVWADGEAAPASSALAIGTEPSLPLVDLLESGALPSCREPSAFNIALCAFDADGNMSALSDPVRFSWQVLCLNNLQ